MLMKGADLMFTWNDPKVGKIHAGLVSLAKTNGGFWKTEKQGLFIIKNYATRKDKFHLLSIGIECQTPDAICIVTSATISNGFTNIPYTNYFIIDEKGIVIQYRVHYKKTYMLGMVPSNSTVTWVRAKAS